MDDKTAKQLVAEAIGTFALTFLGAGAGAIGVGGLVGVAFAHGLAIVAMAYSIGHISGAHINPAVTVAMIVGNKMDAVKGVMYIVAQLIGATVAGFILLFIVGDALSNGATALASGYTAIQGLVAEIVITFFLVFTIFGAAVSGKAGNLAGLAIGLVLAAGFFIAGPVTGASYNPARTFGPALASGNWSVAWIYWVGPIAGGVIAALVQKYLQAE